MSVFEDQLAWQMKAAGLPEPKRQFRFHPTRRWSADFCWPDPEMRLIVEVDGAVYVAGAHTRGKGYEDDRERDAEATVMGYRVIRCTPSQVKSGKALDWIEALLK